jgi:ABC-type multidrug transport system ATPase subunit
MTYSIQISNLLHHFDNQQKVLNNINIFVPEGSIYGFLGTNGAGKTTSLRLMLGLLQKQESEIKILDKTFENNRIEILKQTGSLIEYPSIYGQLTAKQNVLVWQKNVPMSQKSNRGSAANCRFVGNGQQKNKQFFFGYETTLRFGNSNAKQAKHFDFRRAYEWT